MTTAKRVATLGRMDHHHPSASHVALQYERLVFFSDAVFAIAITLLVLDLKLPQHVRVSDMFTVMGPKFLGFAISFAVIGVYWMAHHRLFGTLIKEDAHLRLANLAFLASIIFLPFPTSIIAERPAETASVVLYAGSASAVGLLLVLLALVARRPNLMERGETRGGTIHFVTRSLAAPTVFLSSIVIASTEPRWAAASWILIWPAIFVSERVGRRLQQQAERSSAGEHVR